MGVDCMNYKPKPIDISGVKLPDDLQKLKELLAKNTHEVWAKTKIDEGWRYAKKRNDRLKATPQLVPYEELPESEKNYDRVITINILKAIIKLRYEIKKAKE